MTNQRKLAEDPHANNSTSNTQSLKATERDRTHREHRRKGHVPANFTNSREQLKFTVRISDQCAVQWCLDLVK